MPNKNRFTQENSTTVVAKPEIVPLMTAKEAALNRSRDMLESTTPYDNYTEAKDFGIIGKLRSQIGSKLINKGASNCTLSATNCYGDTYGTARSIVSGKTKFVEIPMDSIQPGDLVIQSLPGVPDGTENKYHTMIYDHKAPWTYVDEEGDLVREGDMLFNYSRGKKSKGQYVQKAKSFTDKNEGKTHYRGFTYKYNKGGKQIFDAEKVYNRVPGRESIEFKSNPFAGTWGGPIGAILHYSLNNDNYVQNLVNEAIAILNNPNESTENKDAAIDYLKHEDAKSLYLGFPQRFGMIEESPYKPTLHSSDSDKYYRFKTSDAEKRSFVKQANDLKHNQSKPGFHDILNNFKLSKGIDPDKGTYVSIYDIWDYNTKISDAPGDNVGKYIGGKPFDIYDRIYLNDYYGVNPTKNDKGIYEGGYLPEITVTLTKDSKKPIISSYRKGGKAYYIESLDKFIKKNSKLYGINTKDFRDFFIELVGLESSYNSKATNSKGDYGGWYATKGGDNLSEYDQHKEAFKHLSKLFKENITDLDLTTAKNKGITQAQLLAKYWNQGNRVTNYIHNNIDDSDGLGTKISEYGNNINVDIDYSRYTPEAITGSYVIVENNKTLPNAIVRFRGDGINYSDRENSIINTNKIVYEKKGKKEFNPNKVQVGDTIWKVNPFIPNPPKELVPQQFKLKSGGIIKRFN